MLQAARLQAVLAGDSETYLSQRHVADILAEFPAAKLTPLEACLFKPPPTLCPTCCAIWSHNQLGRLAFKAARHESAREGMSVCPTSPHPCVTPKIRSEILFQIELRSTSTREATNWAGGTLGRRCCRVWC